MKQSASIPKRKTNLVKSILIVFTMIFATTFSNTFAQNGVSIGTGAPADPSSMLDVTSTTKGMLAPRMTAAQRTAIGTPANGLLVYQIDAPIGFWYYNGTSWVQAIGPQGPTGATGATGPQGPTGATGATGAQGPQGDPGATGATGAQGPQGDPGATGATGAQGDPGATGATGAQGPQGDPGATGAQGPQGDPGATGAQGPQGDPGATGPAPSGTGFVSVNGGVLTTPGQLTGDVTTSGSSLSTTVEGINGTSLAGLSTGLLKNTTGTGIPSIATGADLPSGSSNYVQNGTSPQTASFNVTGIGTVGGILTVNSNDIRGNAGNQNLVSLGGNGSIRMRLDIDNSGTNDFAIQSGTGSNVFLVTESGATTVGNLLTAGIVTNTAAGLLGTTQFLPAANHPALTGDVTSVAGSLTTTLPNIVTAGTNPLITYNAKGQVTAGAPLGQFCTTTGSTSATANMALTTFTLVPGLTQTFTLSSPMYVQVQTHGPYNQSSFVGTDAFGVYVYVDGSFYFMQELYSYENSSFVNDVCLWSGALGFNLGAGSHTIAIYGYLRLKNSSGTSTAGGGSGTVRQAFMTITALRP